MKNARNNLIASTLRRFCESPHRWLIVTAVTSVIALVSLWPLVDDHYAGKNECIELSDNLRNARIESEDLGVLEERVGGITSQLEAIEGRTVSEATVGEYRSRVVDLARDSNCQVRKITVGSVQTRPWYENDTPIRGVAGNGNSKQETGLELQKQTLSLSISGSMAGLNTLLDRMYDNATLMHVKNLEVRPTGQNRKKSILDIELWFFRLAQANMPS